MKRMTKVLSVAAVLALPGAAAMALGIAGTDHDFATKYLTTQTDGGAGTNAVLVGTANSVGLCTYCHTPHSALSTTLLWNHNLSGNTFTWSDATSTTGGTAYASMSPTYKGSSVKCLSCHDGSVAIGDISLYKEISPAVFNTFTLATQTIKKIGAGGVMNGNHPVGMPYPFNQQTSTYNGIPVGARVPLTEFVADPVNQNGTFIRLYNDNGSGVMGVGAVAGKTGMECSSCHDPHNNKVVNAHVPSTSTGVVGPTLLLRAAIDGSTASDGYICTQCHIK